MDEYEIVNEVTGEIESFQSQVDIKQIEEYNQWRIDKMLNPPTYSALEYAKHVEVERDKLILKEARDMVEFYYQVGHPLPYEILERLKDVLNGKK
jgi:hypothetical protein